MQKVRSGNFRLIRWSDGAFTLGDLDQSRPIDALTLHDFFVSTEDDLRHIKRVVDAALGIQPVDGEQVIVVVDEVE